MKNKRRLRGREGREGAGGEGGRVGEGARDSEEVRKQHKPIDFFITTCAVVL